MLRQLSANTWKIQSCPKLKSAFYFFSVSDPRQIDKCHLKTCRRVVQTNKTDTLLHIPAKDKQTPVSRLMTCERYRCPLQHNKEWFASWVTGRVKLAKKKRRMGFFPTNWTKSAWFWPHIHVLYFQLVWVFQPTRQWTFKAMDTPLRLGRICKMNFAVWQLFN